MCGSFVWWGDTHPITALPNTVLLCERPACTQGPACILAHNHCFFLGRGSVFEAPFPLARWFIHPVMNEEAVKRQCRCSLLYVCHFFCQLTKSKERETSRSQLSVYHTLSTVDKTYLYTDTNYGPWIHRNQGWAGVNFWMFHCHTGMNLLLLSLLMKARHSEEMSRRF